MDPTSLSHARLYLLLTRDLCLKDPLDTVNAVLAGGVQVVQIREKTMGRKELRAWIDQVMPLTAAARVPLIINDDVQLAIESSAAGAHLGQSDDALASWQGRVPEGFVLGRSTHSPKQASAAQHEGANYIGVGPLFNTATKGMEGRGLNLLRDALTQVRIPAFGIGGLNRSNLEEACAAGLRRAAICSAIIGSENPESAARDLRRILDAASGDTLSS